MPIDHNATLAIQDALRDLARRLDGAPHRQRGELVNEFAELVDWSSATVYRRLKTIGWTSGRKPRADKGTTSQDEATLIELAAALRAGVRKNGKVTMQTPNARSLLAANGRALNVSNARLNQLLRDRQMDIARQKQDRAVQPLKSLHPNHVHLVDPSLCLIYYLPDGGQRVISDAEAYKNKPEAITRIGDLKVWRYVLVDHYSGSVLVRYYQAAGETQANLYDFLLWCWGRCEGRPFHGVPKILYWDKGSANTAAAIRVALGALQVEPIEHTAGNPRAKGAVEQANNLVEKLFESRLRYEPVANVDELNAAAEAWANAYNANTIPHYDSRLRRKLMATPAARFELWQLIRQEQLRILPEDQEVLRYLLTSDPVERKVAADLTVSFRHPNTKRREFYDVSHLPGVFPRAVVRVSPLIYGHDAVLVYVDDYRGEEAVHELQALPRDDRAGFRHDAAEIGVEMKSQPDTVVERAGKAADRAAFPDMSVEEIDKAKARHAKPFGGLDAHSHLHNVQTPAYMQRRGTELDVPDRVNVEVKPLTHTQAAVRLAREHGLQLTREQHALLGEWYPEGIPEDELNELATRICAPAANQRSAAAS